MTRRLSLLSALFLAACLPEKPDPASQAAAILHKRPADFLDQLSALDAVAAHEIDASPANPGALVEIVRLDAARLKPRLSSLDDSARVAFLTAWIFDSLRIVPVFEDTSLALSLPSRVLASKRGSCVGLTLLYLAYGHALELPLHPVFLPGHVFVRYRSPTLTRNIETLRGGLDRSDAFYDSAFALARRPWYQLKDAEPRQGLGALVFNLANTHRARGSLDLALEEFRLAAETIPGLPEAVGSQGTVLLALGREDEARAKFVTALGGDSLAAPALKNLEILGKPRSSDP